MAALVSGIDLLGPFVDGDAILDGISRRSQPARAAAFVTARARRVAPTMVTAGQGPSL